MTQSTTEMIGCMGSKVFLELPEHGFYRVYPVHELWKLRRDLREATHIPSGCRLRAFREIERIEAEVEPIEIEYDQELEEVRHALCALCVTLLIGVFLIGWILWAQ
jgi:hypothetical protein